MYEDLLIIGGGVVGLSLAWVAAERGLTVRILERGEPGREASWAGAGIIPPTISHAPVDPPLEALLRESRRLHPVWSRRLLELTGVDNEYRVCGAWYAAQNDVELAELHALQAAWNAAGIASAWRTDDHDAASDEKSDAEFYVGPDRRFARHALYVAAEAQLRNPRYLSALRAACETAGVRFTLGETPTGIHRDGATIIGVRTDREIHRAGQTVICAGAWSAQVARLFDTTLPIRPIRGQMLLLRTETSMTRIINHGLRYLVPRRDGHVLVGSTEEDVGFVKANDDAALNALREFAVACSPRLESATVVRAWSGLRPAYATKRPAIGRLPGWNNAWIAAGHFRNGLSLSPATATALTSAILGETPAVDLAPFAIDSLGA